MFDRWFKAKGPAVPLDLAKHRPSEFQGKSVVLNGQEYTIGSKVRDSDQGCAHRLNNTLSGLSLHLIQIRKEYATQPEQAWLASKEKQDATAGVRNQFLKDGQPIPMGVVTAWQAHGGSFEVHETAWGSMGSDGEPPGAKEVSQALACSANGDRVRAIQILEGVLLLQPHHTAALANLAASYDAQGHTDAALDAMTKAAAAEPNFSHYLGAQVQLAVNSQRRRSAVPYYEKLRLTHPHVRDFCIYGVHAYLRAGLPDLAQKALLVCPLPKAPAAEFQTMVTQAIEARQRLAKLESVRFGGEGAHLSMPELLAEFEAISALAPVDPRIQANFGFALRQNGEHARAVSLLLGAAGGINDALVPACWANAAYCFLELSEWANAFNLLGTVMGVLGSSGRPIAPEDVPGLVNWIRDDGAVSEDISPPAYQALERGIANCPDKTLIKPEVRHMVDLLRQFAANFPESASAA